MDEINRNNIQDPPHSQYPHHPTAENLRHLSQTERSLQDERNLSPSRIMQHTNRGHDKAIGIKK